MFLRSSLVMTLTLCLTIATAELAKAAKKERKTHGVRGTVVAVERTNDDSAVLTIKPEPGRHNKKKGTAIAASPQPERKVQVGKNTKIELVVGKNDTLEIKPATFADVRQGERVMIRGGSDSMPAEVVMIHEGRRK